MPVVHERRSYMPPWAWVAIILGLLLVIMVVWLVAAGTRDRTDERYGIEPTPAPMTPEPVPAPEPQPQATTEPDRTVHVYIQEREQATPNVVIIDRDQSPPTGSEYRAVDVPGEFNLFGQDWRAEQRALVQGDDVDLTETGQRIEGKNVYAAEDDQRPYESVYIETSAGSNMYIRYEPRY